MNRYNIYIPALAFLFVIVSFLIYNAHILISTNHNIGVLLDKSGKQRMLSQKLVILAQRFQSSRSDHARKNYASAIDLMRSDHRWILEKVKKDDYAKEFYFKSPNIDNRVNAYLSLNKQMLDNPSAETLGKLHIATEDILIYLDRAVKMHAKYEESTIDNVEKNNVYLFIIFTVVLILEVLFIFHPNAKSLKKQTEQVLLDAEEMKHFKDTIDKYVIYSRANTKGVITDASEAFCELSEYTKEELIGEQHNIVRHPDMSRSVFADLWSTIKSGKEWRGEIKNLTKSGGYYWVSARVSSEYDLNGKLIGYISIRQDITAQKELDASKKELLSNQERILELSKAKENFLASMSHEIRTPLNGIMGITDMLLDNEITEAQKSLLEIIKSSSDSLMLIINDILDFSALQSGKFRILHQEYSIRALVKKISSLIQPQIEEKGIVFTTHVENGLKDILIGDEYRIHQVLMNLLSNAKKFTRHGTIDVNVFTKENSGAKTLCFSVQDSGIGMSDEVQANMFKEFNQGFHSNSIGGNKGTGLGLNISKRLATLMGGDITFVSKEKEGTTFYFEIPLTVSENQAKLSEKKDEFLLLSEPKKALLADDSKTNQMVLEAYLEKIGFDVTLVNDGKEALVEAKNNHYDIIFLDIQMPIMNGHEATKAIRQFNSSIPIVALSAGVMPFEVEASLNAGMNAHISKPIIVSEMNDVLEQYLKTSVHT